MNMQIWKYENNILDSNFNQDNFISFIGNKKKADEIWKKEKAKLEKVKGEKKIITEKIQNSLFFLFTNNVTKEDILDYIGNNSSMLVITYGERKISHSDVLFRNLIFKNPEILNDKFVEQMIMEIDECEHVSGTSYKSKYFGPTDANNLSSGVKALIVYYATDFPIDLSCCGDNCSELFTKITKLKIKENKKAAVVLGHLFEFTEDIFPVYSSVSHKTLNNFDEYLFDYDEWSIKVYAH